MRLVRQSMLDGPPLSVKVEILEYVGLNFIVKTKGQH